MSRSRSNNANSNANNTNNINNGLFDPFAGFEGFAGFGFGRSMMQDFFGRDPFNDPFFTSPFGSLLEQRQPFGSRQEVGRRGPVIEEILGDHADSGSRSRSSQEPIVEHPEDDHNPPDHNRSRRKNGEGVQTYSFSSFTSSGPNGGYYTSSSSRRRGPNGVVHEEHYENDSVARTETERVSLGLNDKGHTVTRKRNAEGREERSDTLHNLSENEVEEFDSRWETEAERNLGFNRNRARSLGGRRNEGTRTSSRGRSLAWSGAHQA